jgi:hypothetical protein
MIKLRLLGAIIAAAIAYSNSFTSALTFNSTVLVVCIDAVTGDQASYLFNGYGIGYETSILSDIGAPLPILETSNGGNYGLFVVVGRAISNGTSRLTSNQWESLWSYQRKYGIRMVHINVSPDVQFGTQLIDDGGCCDEGVEQNMTLVGDVAAREFPNAGLK